MPSQVKVERRLHSYCTWATVMVMSLALNGCGTSPPATSAAAQATVHGIIKLRGKPVGRGLIRFQATGRDGATRLLSAPIGQGGSYRVATLIGPNTITFVLPEAAKGDPSLNSQKVDLDAKPGDNTLNIDLPRS